MWQGFMREKPVAGLQLGQVETNPRPLRGLMIAGCAHNLDAHSLLVSPMTSIWYQ